MLKMRLLAADDADVENILQELTRLGMLHRFEDDSTPFGAIRNFCKWQRPKKPTVCFPLPNELRTFVGLPDAAAENETTKRKSIWSRFEGRCFYCDDEVTHYSKRHDSLEVDHILPVSRGGSDDEGNLTCACRNCNRAKGDMTAKDFFAFRKTKSLPVSRRFASSVGGLSRSDSDDSDAKDSFRGAKGGFASQMEDGGGRKERTLTSFVTPDEPSSPVPPPETREVAVLEGRSGGVSPKPTPPVDARTALFSIGIVTLRHMTGKPDKACRALVGKWLKATRDDCAALNAILLDAAETRPAEPIAWIEKAVRHRTQSDVSRTERDWNLDSYDFDAESQKALAEWGQK
ncbi:HNH endonuclease [Kozakia baliensis]|uniref:HNH endonuclease n=1 Tax=Kozakia baliensis TaxID=153496 RepID=UPI001269513F|nr:HNH endonuclease [Kozakia baliensis]